jgi:hypothetical protein
MTRKPGISGARIVGAFSELRARRAQQVASRSTGDDLGSAMQFDERGRLSVKRLPRVDPSDPQALDQLIAFMRERGFME